MGQFDLNLSTRPFKPYRAANLGLFILLLILAAISAMQISNYQQYSSLAADSRAVEKQAKEESELLTRQLDALNKELSTGNAPMKLAEIQMLNDLLVRKSFSWTSLFANLERVMPENVRLVNLHPFVDQTSKKTGFNMEIRGRTLTDATVFLRTLESSPVFTDVILATEERKDSLGEVAFSLSSLYDPYEVEDKARTTTKTKTKGKTQ